MAREKEEINNSWTNKYNDQQISHLRETESLRNNISDLQSNVKGLEVLGYDAKSEHERLLDNKSLAHQEWQDFFHSERAELDKYHNNWISNTEHRHNIHDEQQRNHINDLEQNRIKLQKVLDERINELRKLNIDRDDNNHKWQNIAEKDKNAINSNKAREIEDIEMLNSSNVNKLKDEIALLEDENRRLSISLKDSRRDSNELKRIGDENEIEWNNRTTEERDHLQKWWDDK